MGWGARFPQQGNSRVYLEGNSGRRPGHAVHVDITPEYQGHGQTAVSASGEGRTQSRRRGSRRLDPSEQLLLYEPILSESDSQHPEPDVEPGLASASSQGRFPGLWGDRRSPSLLGGVVTILATEAQLLLAPSTILTFRLDLDFSTPELTLVPLLGTRFQDNLITGF